MTVVGLVFGISDPCRIHVNHMSDFIDLYSFGKYRNLLAGWIVQEITDLLFLDRYKFIQAFIL